MLTILSNINWYHFGAYLMLLGAARLMWMGVIHTLTQFCKAWWVATGKSEGLRVIFDVSGTCFFRGTALIITAIFFLIKF